MHTQSQALARMHLIYHRLNIQIHKMVYTQTISNFSTHTLHILKILTTSTTKMQVIHGNEDGCRYHQAHLKPPESQIKQVSSSD